MKKQQYHRKATMAAKNGADDISLKEKPSAKAAAVSIEPLARKTGEAYRRRR